MDRLDSVAPRVAIVHHAHAPRASGSSSLTQLASLDHESGGVDAVKVRVRQMIQEFDKR